MSCPYCPSTYFPLQRFAEFLQIEKAKNDTAHAQYLKDQRKKGERIAFRFFGSCKNSANRCISNLLPSKLTNEIS